MAAVYDALADLLRAVGGNQFTARRQALTSALNAAYDELLTARSTATGRNRQRMRLVGALNASHLMAEAAVTVGLAGIRPPPLVIETVFRLGDSIRNGTPPPMIPPPWDDRAAMLALRDAMAGGAGAVPRAGLPRTTPAPACGSGCWAVGPGGVLRVLLAAGAGGAAAG